MSEYFLKPSQPSKRVQKYAVIDIETQDWINPVLFGFYDGAAYQCYTTARALMDACLTQKYENHIFYAYNGGRFDFQFLVEAGIASLAARVTRPGFEMVPSGGKILMMSFYKERSVGDNAAAKKRGKRQRSWKFWDFMQVARGGPADTKDDERQDGSLEALCKLFGTQLQKTHIDYATIADTPEVRAYLKNDCLALYELIGKFYDLPPLRGVPHVPTTSSLALQTFKRKHLVSPVPCLSPENEEFCKNAYHGGRVEIFKTHVFGVNEYDAVNMYGWAMTQVLPIGHGVERFKYTGDERDFGFWDVEVCVPACYIPILPYYDTQQKKLLFPCGRFRGTYFSEELRLAIEQGAQITKVHRGLTFAKVPLLRDYALTMFKLRNEYPKGTPMNDLAKLLNNGLYGKTGENRDKRKAVFLPYKEALERKLEPAFEPLSLWWEPVESTATHILPNIAAAITAYARVHLFQGFLHAGLGSLAYCDTDSCWTTERMESGTYLGDWKLEKNYAEFIGVLPKIYYAGPTDGIDAKKRAKGFRYNLVKKLGRDEYARALVGDFGAFQFEEERFGHVQENWRRGNGMLGMLVKRRSIRTPYTKRIVLADGETAPLSVGM